MQKELTEQSCEILRSFSGVRKGLLGLKGVRKTGKTDLDYLRGIKIDQ